MIFTALITFLAPLWTQLLKLVGQLWFRVGAGFLVFMALIKWVLAMLHRSLGDVAQLVTNLQEKGDEVSAHGSVSGAVAAMEVAGVINSIVPLEEALAWFSALFAFWAIVIAIRWLKSVIPTVSN